MSATCLRCAAPRADGPECPSCGVVYAKAERHAPVPSAAASWARRQELDEARAELSLARFAVPVALLVSFVLVHTAMGAFFLRTLFGMWLHELGHAVTAWLCGFPAFPGPWVTSIAFTRSYGFAAVVTAALGWGAWRAWKDEERAAAGFAVAGLGLQLVGTVFLSARTAQTLITFGGDAGSIVFGAALMSTFFTPPGHKLHRDWLRWGFLVIGAGSFVDTFSTWWAARHNYTVIPFGEIEGVGDSDPTKLVAAGWPVSMIVSRYVALGIVSLIVVLTLQVLYMRSARAGLSRRRPD